MSKKAHKGSPFYGEQQEKRKNKKENKKELSISHKDQQNEQAYTLIPRLNALHTPNKPHSLQRGCLALHTYRPCNNNQ